MVTILIILAMLLSFGLGAFVATKTLQLGLKYQVLINKEVAPELNVFERIDRERERKEVEKVNNLTSEMLSDIMGG
jgi:predicted secreted protein